MEVLGLGVFKSMDTKDDLGADDNDIHHEFMAQAIEQAKKAEAYDEVPIGAVIVYENQVISSAYNQTITECNPCFHAEIIAIRQACKVMNNHRLTNCTLYVTLEPCLMCFGAIIQARFEKVVFGASDNRFGVIYPLGKLKDEISTNYWPGLVDGVMHRECSSLLSAFFKRKRHQKKRRAQLDES